MEDQWRDREKGMICKTCVFFVPKYPVDAKSGYIVIGRCRRRSPTMNGYPVVFEKDWCGDHKLDENKI